MMRQTSSATTAAVCPSYVNIYESGHLTGQFCFGPEGEPVLNNNGWHGISKSFDEGGGLLQRECYYGTQGKRIESTYYNGDGSLKDIECSRFRIPEVLEGYPAARAGLQSGGIIIVYNLWSIRSIFVDTGK